MQAHTISRIGIVSWVGIGFFGEAGLTVTKWCLSSDLLKVRRSSLAGVVQEGMEEHRANSQIDDYVKLRKHRFLFWHCLCYG